MPLISIFVKSLLQINYFDEYIDNIVLMEIVLW